MKTTLDTAADIEAGFRRIRRDIRIIKWEFAIGFLLTVAALIALA